MKLPHFSRFKKEVFNKINKNQKDILFYWSLFDPTGGWEEIQVEYLPDFNAGEEKVLSILKTSDFISQHFIKENKEIFYRDFVKGETLTNYLIAARVETRIEMG